MEVSFKFSCNYFRLSNLQSQTRQEILDEKSSNSLDLINVEKVHKVEKLFPKRSMTNPLPNLRNLPLSRIFVKYFKILWGSKIFKSYLVIFAFNNSSLLVFAIFSNLICGSFEVINLYSSCIVSAMIICGITSSLIYSVLIIQKPNQDKIQAIYLFLCVLLLYTFTFFLVTR